jgi:hypothetical protein
MIDCFLGILALIGVRVQSSSNDSVPEGYMRFFIACCFFALSLSFAPLLAQDDTGFASLPALPAASFDADAPIRLSPDGPAVIKLNEDATSVIVGNPAHATALLETPRLLMLMPAQPGTTKLMILNREGKTILNKHVLVGGSKAGFKRITRVCAAGKSTDCKPVSAYYCPDKCYESAIPEAGVDTTATGDLASPPVQAAPAPEGLVVDDAPNPDDASGLVQ